MNNKVAEKLLRQKKRADDDDSDDDFVATPAKSTAKAKTRVKSRRQSSFAPSPAITPVTPSIGLVLSAPDRLSQHDGRWTFGGRRQPGAQVHGLRAILLLNGP